MTFLTYENLKRGIRINYPSDWELVENEWQIDLAFAAPYERDLEYRGSIVVSIEDLSQEPMTLNEFTELSLNEFKSTMEILSIDEQAQAKLAGHEAFKLNCSIKKDNFKLQWWQIWTIIENKLYIVSYTHGVKYFSKYLEIVQEIAKSLEII